MYHALTHNGFGQVSYNSESTPIILPYVIDYLGNEFGFGGLVPCKEGDCLIFYGSFQYYNETPVGASIAIYDVSLSTVRGYLLHLLQRYQLTNGPFYRVVWIQAK